jgi:hypothetical protein
MENRTSRPQVHDSVITAGSSNLRRTALLFAFVTHCLISTPITAAIRVWTDNTASYKIEAELSQIQQNAVELRTADGRLIEVPLERLSEADREFVQSELNQPKKPEEKRVTPDKQETPPQPESSTRSVQKDPRKRKEPASTSNEPLNSLIGGTLCAGVIFGLVGLVLTLSVQSRKRNAAKQDASANYDNAYKNLRRFVSEKFLVQPCSRCHEYVMQLMEVSPNARSVKYCCQHCGKSSHAAAISPDAVEISEFLEKLRKAVEQYRNAYSIHVEEPAIEFSTTPAPLPYEQTQRSPIPQSVRAEVWRRDQGKCTTCGSNANLQYDHIIPVARGGATTVMNLQLLCQRCNQAKGAKI